MVHGLTWGDQLASGQPATLSVSVPERLAAKLGDQLNVGALLDAGIITGWGSWNAVVTAQGWEKTSDAQRAAQILLEIFQLPAILAFLANVIAKKAENPVTTGIAVTLATVREGAMIGSSVAEFVAAADA
jgi:hypothetical protein